MSSGVDRGGRNDVRQRRALQKLGYDPLGTLGIVAGNGIIINTGDNSIAVNLASTTPGLNFTDGLTVDLRDTDPGLELTASGIGVLLKTNSGLTTTGGTGIVLSQTRSILELTSSGLGTKFITASGASDALAIVTITGGTASNGRIEMTSGQGTTPGRLQLSQSKIVLAIDSFTSAAHPRLTLTTLNVGFDLLKATQFYIQNDTNASIYFETNVANVVAGFGGTPLVFQPPPYSVTNPGDETHVIGGPATGSNQNGGAAYLIGGPPTGSGRSESHMAVTDSGGVVTTRILCNLSGIGFFGATPIAQPGTYTITAAPAVSTALNADANGGAYTGVPGALGDAATLVDLNNLRADVESLAAVLRQLIRHLGDTNGLGLVNETSY